MVVRGWGGSIATAIGVAAAVGAAQVGLGYGLEIISWRTGVEGLSSDAWLASLAWATWIAATSTVVGAVVADRMAAGQPGEPSPRIPQPRLPESLEATPAPAPRPDLLATGLWRLVLGASAAVGATATVALTAVPARLAEPPETTSPLTVAAGYAILGVLVGLVLSVGALAARAAAANVIVSAAWLWLLAVVAVVDGVLDGRDWDRVPLAFWEFTAVDPDRLWGVAADSQSWFGNIFVPDAALAGGAALVLGALAALPAVRRGDHPVGVVVSGGAGPVLVAAAYLLAQPTLVGADMQTVDVSRHLVVPYLVLAGLLGSLLISAARPRANRAATAEPVPETFAGDGVAEDPELATAKS